jgi:aspartate 1-decarboxylase
LAQEWDSRSAQFAYQNANNVIGVLGTDPTSVQPYYDARRRMKELACPPGGKRGMIISSSMMSSFGQNITTFFNPADEISKMFKEGSLGKAAGFDWFESNSLWSHTAGTAVTSLQVTGASQSGASLIVTGTATQTLKKGDKISIVNVNQVNPRTRRIPGKAQVKHFTVTQDITLTAGPDTINILPAIYGPGSQYQNVDALPADTAAITLWPGTSSPSGKVGTVGLALSPYAFAKVGAKLYTPKSVEAASQEQDKDTGMAVRFVKAWDPVRSMNVHRFDTLGGFGLLYQDNGAVCVAGA